TRPWRNMPGSASRSSSRRFSTPRPSGFARRSAKPTSALRETTEMADRAVRRSGGVASGRGSLHALRASLGWLAQARKNAAFFLLIFTVCFTVGPFLRYCSQHRYFAVRAVELLGAQRLDVARLRASLRRLGMVEGRSIWETSPRAVEAALESDPAI